MGQLSISTESELWWLDCSCRIRSVRDFCQKLVGLLLFRESLLKDLRVFRKTQYLGPVAGAAIRSDFIMLNLLRCGDQACVTDGALVCLFRDVFPGANDCGQNWILFVSRIVDEIAEKVLDPQNMIPCLLKMIPECLLKLHVLGMFNHLWKAVDDLVFGRQQVAQLCGVKFAQARKVVRRNETHIDLPQFNLRAFVHPVLEGQSSD